MERAPALFSNYGFDSLPWMKQREVLGVTVRVPFQYIEDLPAEKMLAVGCGLSWRRERDSNPRTSRSAVFKTAALNRSAIPPLSQEVIVPPLDSVWFKQPRYLGGRTTRFGYGNPVIGVAARLSSVMAIP